VSRATVTLGYEQLISEGYLETAVGSGTSVSAQLPDDLLQAPLIKVPARNTTPKSTGRPALSAFGASLSQFAGEPDDPTLLFNFTLCRPAVDQFPLEQWRRLLLRHCRSGQHDVLDYAEGGKGSPPLRQAIARYLAHSRAVNCIADQIIIVNGSQQALQLCAQLLVNRDDLVAMEDPGYLGARQAFIAHGARLHPVPVDENGIQL
jgi:GntR family transcriptional regulator/MocR family aminotransferase